MLVEIESPFIGAGVIIGWTSKCYKCAKYSIWSEFNDDFGHVYKLCMCIPTYTILVCDDKEVDVSESMNRYYHISKIITIIFVNYGITYFIISFMDIIAI